LDNAVEDHHRYRMLCQLRGCTSTRGPGKEPYPDRACRRDPGDDLDVSGNEGEKGQKDLRDGKVANYGDITGANAVLECRGILDLGINRGGSCIIENRPHPRDGHDEEHGNSQEEEGKVRDCPVTEWPAVPREINEGEVGKEGGSYQ
jgi:hypothetical protein